MLELVAIYTTSCLGFFVLLYFFCSWLSFILLFTPFSFFSPYPFFVLFTPSVLFTLPTPSLHSLHPSTLFTFSPFFTPLPPYPARDRQVSIEVRVGVNVEIEMGIKRLSLLLICSLVRKFKQMLDRMPKNFSSWNLIRRDSTKLAKGLFR